MTGILRGDSSLAKIGKAPFGASRDDERPADSAAAIISK
ncbi:hypothetical protein ACVWY5_000889 [Bradyrhizobium sp. USDA 3256]